MSRIITDPHGNRKRLFFDGLQLQHGNLNFRSPTTLIIGKRNQLDPTVLLGHFRSGIKVSLQNLPDDYQFKS